MNVGDSVTVMGGRFQGRAGTVHRLPKLFAEWAYVKLLKRPRERREKIPLIERKHLALVGAPSSGSE